MSTDDSTLQNDSIDFSAQAQQLTDLVVENPMPSVLAAAATGAALMALIALAARPKSYSLPKVSMPDVSMPDVSLPKMPKAAQKLMSDAEDIDTGSLKDQLSDLLQRVSDAIPSKRQARSRLQDVQDSVQDGVQSTWNTVRDQASDMIDQVQPQLAAATKVARENPLWAALVVGALGTLLGSQLLGKASSK